MLNILPMRFLIGIVKGRSFSCRENVKEDLQLPEFEKLPSSRFTVAFSNTRAVSAIRSPLYIDIDPFSPYR